MTPGSDLPGVGPATRPRRGQRGQMVVLLALALIAMLAMAGLLVDGGMAWVNRRQVQTAADTAVLAAGVAIRNGVTIIDDVKAAAYTTAGANGVPQNFTDCSGAARSDGVLVSVLNLSAYVANGHPASVEVITTRAMQTAFAGVVGQNCWMVSARAVVLVRDFIAACSLCSTSQGPALHKVLLDNGANVRVDGAIVVYGSNMFGPCPPIYTWPYVKVCGAAVELHANGNTHLSAGSISIEGGWETRGGNVMQADAPAKDNSGTPCPDHPEPPAYMTLSVVANVCIDGVWPGYLTPDPLNNPTTDPRNRIQPPDPSAMYIPQAGRRGCTAVPGTLLKIPTGIPGNPVPTDINNGQWTICPGLYYGGFHVSGGPPGPTVYMLPGIYYMAGGGFWVLGSANITSVLPGGLDLGVMIYNSGVASPFSSSSEPAAELVPQCDPLLPSACKDTIVDGGLPATPNGLSSSDNPTNVGLPVTYTMRLEHTLPLSPDDITGKVTFYDGSDPIAGCSDVDLVVEDPTHSAVTCSTNYLLFGSRAINAVYFGDANYAPNDDLLFEQVNTPPTGGGFGRIRLSTIDSPPGHITLHAPTLGPYRGLLIFQDRNNPHDVDISPGDSDAPSCGAGFLLGVPPAPCGRLGGLSGTIYSPHECGTSPCGAGDYESVVNFNASGAANLQVIAAKIFIYNGDIRLTFDASKFANAQLNLIE